MSGAFENDRKVSVDESIVPLQQESSPKFDMPQPPTVHLESSHGCQTVAKEIDSNTQSHGHTELNQEGDVAKR
jgi:hypothetical protein